MDKEKAEDYQVELNKISFWKCEGIDIGDALHYTLQLFDEGKKGGLLRSFLSMVKSSIVNVYDYKIIGNGGNTLALYSNSSGIREDHIRAFDAVVGLLDCTIVKLGKCRIRPVNKWMIIEIIKWFRQIKNVIPSTKLKMVLVKDICYAYGTYEYINKLKAEKGVSTEYVITWCDVMPTESFITQKMKQENSTMITLCHGDYNVNRDDWPYRNLKSDYILVHSEFSAKNARMVNCPAKVIVTGDPHILTKEIPEKRISNKTDIVGLVINSRLMDESNVPMIKFVQNFCKETNRKLIIKTHPSYPDGFFDKYLDKDVQIYGRDLSIQEFAKKINVAVVSNSTVFTEMLYLWKPVFLYRGKYDYHCYEGIDGIHFDSSDELEKLLTKVEKNEIISLITQCRNYYVVSGDARDAYKRAFQDIGMG